MCVLLSLVRSVSTIFLLLVTCATFVSVLFIRFPVSPFLHFLFSFFVFPFPSFIHKENCSRNVLRDATWNIVWLTFF